MKLLVTDYDNTLELHYDFTDNISILKRNLKAKNLGLSIAQMSCCFRCYIEVH